ncbi:MAG: FGGY family carbohydrate kinase [Chloroflexota bacterium]
MCRWRSAGAPPWHQAPRPGWSEADPDAVAEAAFGTVREVVEQVGADHVVAIGVSGTACGAWLLDRAGDPVGPAILWNDGRAAAVTASWHATGVAGRIFDISGNAPFPGYTLSVLSWLATNEADRLRAAASVVCCKDFLRHRLTGIVASDESDASYVPMDMRARTWSDELLELTGTSAWRSLLPELLDPRTTQPLLHEPARLTGLRAGTPVAVGATDIVAGLVGAGATRPGDTVSILGTSANSTVISDALPLEPRGIGIMAASPLGRYARSLINTSGSETLDWGAPAHRRGRGQTHGAGRAGACGCRRGDPVPYLSPAGTVSPTYDPMATGGLAGLRSHHGPAHVARAVVEGLALAVADCYDHMALPVDRIRAVGGAARSDLLLQALADLTGHPVDRMAMEESGARGVAVLAAWAVGATDDLDGLAAHADVAHRFEPRADGPLAGALARYQDLARSRVGGTAR